MIKFALSIAIAFVAFIPTWMFIGFRSLLSPQGFFQEFFVLGVGLYLFGAVQIFMAIVGFIFIVGIITARIP